MRSFGESQTGLEHQLGTKLLSGQQASACEWTATDRDQTAGKVDPNSNSKLTPNSRINGTGQQQEHCPEQWPNWRRTQQVSACFGRRTAAKQGLEIRVQQQQQRDSPFLVISDAAGSSRLFGSTKKATKISSKVPQSHWKEQ